MKNTFLWMMKWHTIVDVNEEISRLNHWIPQSGYRKFIMSDVCGLTQYYLISDGIINLNNSDTIRKIIYFDYNLKQRRIKCCLGMAGAKMSSNNKIHVYSNCFFCFKVYCRFSTSNNQISILSGLNIAFLIFHLVRQQKRFLLLSESKERETLEMTDMW